MKLHNLLSKLSFSTHVVMCSDYRVIYNGPLYYFKLKGEYCKEVEYIHPTLCAIGRGGTSIPALVIGLKED